MLPARCPDFHLCLKPAQLCCQEAPLICTPGPFVLRQRGQQAAEGSCRGWNAHCQLPTLPCPGWHVLLPYVPNPGPWPPVPVSGELPSTAQGALINLQPWRDVRRKKLIIRMHLDPSSGKTELGITSYSDFLSFLCPPCPYLCLSLLSCSSFL